MKRSLELDSQKYELQTQKSVGLPLVSVEDERDAFCGAVWHLRTEATRPIVHLSPSPQSKVFGMSLNVSDRNHKGPLSQLSWTYGFRGGGLLRGEGIRQDARHDGCAGLLKFKQNPSLLTLFCYVRTESIGNSSTQYLGRSFTITSTPSRMVRPSVNPPQLDYRPRNLLR